MEDEGIRKNNWPSIPDPWTDEKAIVMEGHFFFLLPANSMRETCDDNDTLSIFELYNANYCTEKIKFPGWWKKRTTTVQKYRD